MMCPLCKVPVSMKHLVWPCSYHQQPVPDEWSQMIAANENTMLWARGLIDMPAYDPIQLWMASSTKVAGPHWASSEVGHWGASHKQGHAAEEICGSCDCHTMARRRLATHCTAVAPGQATEARAWFFGCWLTLQMVLGRHQINIPHRGGWSAIRKGAHGKVAPDLWHHLREEEEWSRLQLVQVPWKMLKAQEGDARGKTQFLMAKQAAVTRAREANCTGE